MTEDKVVTKQFTFDVAASKEPTVELIQIISQAIYSYEYSGDDRQTDIESVIKYFASLYRVKL